MRIETSLSPERKVKENFKAIHNEIPAPEKIVNNETVLKEYEEKTVFKEGRYEVNLPFKIENAWLGDNYTTCKNRLKNLVQKTFKSDEKLFQQYDDIIMQQFSSGMIEKAQNYENGKTHYLPHRPVMHDKEKHKSENCF